MSGGLRQRTEHHCSQVEPCDRCSPFSLFLAVHFEDGLHQSKKHNRKRVLQHRDGHLSLRRRAGVATLLSLTRLASCRCFDGEPCHPLAKMPAGQPGKGSPRSQNLRLVGNESQVRAMWDRWLSLLIDQSPGAVSKKRFQKSSKAAEVPQRGAKSQSIYRVR